MVKQKVSSWDTLQSHPIATKLNTEERLALLCEYLDLYTELQGMGLADFITAYFATKPAVAVAASPETEVDTPEPAANGDKPEVKREPEPRPASMLGMRVVYRFSGRNVLSDKDGVTRDSGKTVAFIDVDGEPWSSVSRDKVFPINPANYKEIEVSTREAKEIEGWLAGTQSKDHPDGEVLKNFTVEFTDFPDKITFAIINGKRPYVDRFVQLPRKGFEDDQKPTTRLFGEHAFRVRNVDYVVDIVTP